MQAGSAGRCLKRFEPLQHTVHGGHGGRTAAAIRVQLRFQRRNSMLAVRELCQQRFSFRTETFMILEEILDGPFESFEVVSFGSR